MAAARNDLRQRPMAVRLAELTGSFLLAAVVGSVMSLVMLLLANRQFDGSPTMWSMFAWIAICTVAASWALLALGKTWETGSGDAIHRRFVMLMVGLLFGAVAFGLGQVLMVEFNDSASLVVTGLPDNHIPDSLYSGDGHPLLPAFLIYFGSLFVLLRWWKQVDPLRKTRLSLWSVFVCVVAAWVMHQLWQFPQPWGFMLAANIAVTTQLSAPWSNGKEGEGP